MTQLHEKKTRIPTCVPIKDMKNTAAFTTLVEEAPHPVTVTKNGYDAFVVMRSEDYEAMQMELARARLLSRVSQAEGEYASGHYAEAKEFTQSMRDTYDL